MPGQPKDPGQFSEAESAQYWNAYLSSRDTQLYARADYESLWRRERDFQRKSRYRQQLIEIENNHLQIEDCRTAFQGGGCRVSPPSGAEVDALKRAADEVDALIAQAQNADRIFRLASDSARFFTQLHQPS